MTQSKTLDTGSDGMEEPLANARLKEAVAEVATDLEWALKIYGLTSPPCTAEMIKHATKLIEAAPRNLRAALYLPEALGLSGAENTPVTKPQTGGASAASGGVRTHPNITKETFAPLWELIRRASGVYAPVRQTAIKNLRDIEASLLQTTEGSGSS